MFSPHNLFSRRREKMVRKSLARVIYDELGLDAPLLCSVVYALSEMQFLRPRGWPCSTYSFYNYYFGEITFIKAI